jgi:hypothetical protein
LNMWKGWKKGKLRSRLWYRPKGRRDPGRPCRMWNSQKLEQTTGPTLEQWEEEEEEDWWW